MRGPVTKRGEVFGTAAAAAVLFGFVHYLMRPAPIPALTGVVGGLIAFWSVRRGRLVVTGAGGLAGAAAGVLAHLYSHASEGRLREPTEGLARHVAVDGLIGLLVAGAVLIVAIASLRAAVQRSGR